MDPISGTALNSNRRRRSPTIPKVLKWSFPVGALQIITCKMGVKHHGNPSKKRIPCQNYEYEFKCILHKITAFIFWGTLKQHWLHMPIWTNSHSNSPEFEIKSHALLVMISPKKSGELWDDVSNPHQFWILGKYFTLKLDQVRVKSCNPGKKKKHFQVCTTFTLSKHHMCGSNEQKHPFKVLQNFKGNSNGAVPKSLSCLNVPNRAQQQRWAAKTLANWEVMKLLQSIHRDMLCRCARESKALTGALQYACCCCCCCRRPVGRFSKFYSTD